MASWPMTGRRWPTVSTISPRPSRYLDGRFRRLPGPPRLWLEYAAGLDPGRFLAVAERLAPIPTAGICLDVGHVGIRAARTTFGHLHPGLDVTTLTTTDPRLPELVDDVQAAVRSALGTVLDLIRGLALLGGPLHFHLHDGHPLRPGLADHVSFLTRLPVPFALRRAQIARPALRRRRPGGDRHDGRRNARPAGRLFHA